MAPLCTVYEAGVVIWKPKVDGLFIRDAKFKDELKEGDVYGRLVDPYTGELLAEMPTPKDGIVIPSGQEWAHRRRHLHRHPGQHRPHRRPPNHGHVRLVRLIRTDDYVRTCRHPRDYAAAHAKYLASRCV